MKRQKFLFEKIVDIQNLHDAYYKASKRKRTSVSYLYFKTHEIENLKRIQKQCKRARYFFKLDVRKYFDNIDHSILKASLKHIIADKKCLNILEKIIDSYSVTNTNGRFFDF